MEPIEGLYFNWLCAKVMKLEGPSTPSLRYWNLLKRLHETEFTWFVSNDDNRVEDGLELRTYFLRETNVENDPHWAAAGCSVLEMLIAFAYRAEFDTDVCYVDWFWKFIEHLDLIRYHDGAIDHNGDIADILETFIWRRYKPNGEGGLFPIRFPTRDQRDVEIWYQFCDYLVDQEEF